MLYDARVNLLFVLCCHRIFNMCIKTNTILENFTFRVMMQMICQPDKNFCKQDSLSKELKQALTLLLQMVLMPVIIITQQPLTWPKLPSMQSKNRCLENWQDSQRLLTYAYYH